MNEEGGGKCLASGKTLELQEELKNIYFAFRDSSENKSVIQKECRLDTYGNTARGFDTVDCNKCRSVVAEQGSSAGANHCGL